jgi:hypothetical protein
MDLPDNLKFRAIFTQGSVFKAKLVEDGDEHERFYFVLNSKAQIDSLILLSTSTTQFDSHKDCQGGDEIHIPVSTEDYTPFTKACLICCGRPLKQVPKERLIKQLKSQKYRLLEPLPQDLLQKILVSIAKSKVIPPAQKKMILPEENNI